MIHLRAFCCLAALAAVPLAAGCGGPKENVFQGEAVDVKGRVVEGGQPVVIPEDQYEEGGSCLEVEMFGTGDEGFGVGNFCGPDGTFTIEGVPVGTYEVTVRRLGETDHESGDMWEGKYARAFTHEVTASGGEMVIELNDAQKK